MSIFYPASLYFINVESFAVYEYYKETGEIRTSDRPGISENSRAGRRAIIQCNPTQTIRIKPWYQQGRFCQSPPARKQNHCRKSIG